jgi:hypothetical protein
MTRILFAAPLAFAVSAVFLGATVSPAYASEAACQAMPQNIRQIAATADQKVARKALGYTRTGEMLCEAGNERAAQKKFETAYKTLGVAEAEYAALAK